MLEPQPLISGAAQPAADILADRLPRHRLPLLPLPLPLALPLGCHLLIAELHQRGMKLILGGFSEGVTGAEIFIDWRSILVQGLTK